jgi:hypothetical protein
MSPKHPLTSAALSLASWDPSLGILDVPVQPLPKWHCGICKGVEVDSMSKIHSWPPSCRLSVSQKCRQCRRVGMKRSFSCRPRPDRESHRTHSRELYCFKNAHSLQRCSGMHILPDPNATGDVDMPLQREDVPEQVEPITPSRLGIN